MKQHTDKILLFLTGVFWVLMVIGQFGRIQVTPAVAIYLHDLIILATLGWFWFKNRTGIFSNLFNKEHLSSWWGFFLGWVVLGAVSASVLNGEYLHWFYLFRVGTYLLFSWVLAHSFVWQRRGSQSMDLLDGYLVTGVVFMAVGLLQYLFFPDTRYLAVFGWDDHYYRLISTQFDPAYAGALILLTFFGLESVRSRNWRVLGQSVAVLAIALTFSRATYLSFIIGVGVFLGLMWWQKKFSWLPLIFIPVLVICVLLAPKPTGEGVDLTRTSTIVSRSSTARSTVSEVKPLEWLLGRGLFVPIKSQPQKTELTVRVDHAKQSDNIGITLLSGLGIVGMILLGKALWSTREYFSFCPSWVWAMGIAISIHSQFNNTLFQPFVFLMLTGMILAADQQRLKSKVNL